MKVIQEIKALLAILDYSQITFVSHDEAKRLYYFDAMIDTHYRVMCEVKSDGIIEVHDTTFEIDNYVYIATAYKKEDHWNLSLH